MKAARERMKGMSLSISTTSKPADGKPDAKKKIKSVSEAEVAKTYKLGGAVMESTNTGMDVIFAKRLADGVECVIKTRKRSNSFKSLMEEREWRMTTEYQLNMPTCDNMCKFYEVLETKEYYYIVMEKVEGQDLFEQMANAKISHVDGREIVRQILSGLNAMHLEGRIHKDLKIENVMVATSPTLEKKRPEGADPMSPVLAKLIDFDTVQDWEPSSPKCKDVLGTDGYIAPEAYAGEYSPASDIYAVGVIMYKLLTGKFPSKAEIFDDEPGENYVGSPAMARIRERLRTEKMDFTRSPLNKCPEAAALAKKMLEFECDARCTADEALASPWFKLDADSLPRK